MYAMTLRIALAALLAAALLPCVSLAQVTIPGFGGTLSIESTPRNLVPNTSIHLSAEDTFVDLSSINLTWTVDGKEVQSGEGLTSYDVELGDLGSVTDVVVTADTNEGTISTEAKLIPTSVDLLWEADSYTPPFYRGRALASAGSEIRLEAIPHFVQPDGSEVPASSLKYVWKDDGTVLGDESGLGRSSATVGISPLSQSATIEVDVTSTDGLYSGSATLSVPLVDPSLTLYEDHPLFGLSYNNALDSSASIPENEMAFAAVPYFAPSKNANDPGFQYTWAVDTKAVSSDAKDPSEITINAQNSSGAASLSLDLSQFTNSFFSISGAWNLLFSAAAPESNIFTNPNGAAH